MLTFRITYLTFLFSLLALASCADADGEFLCETEDCAVAPLLAAKTIVVSTNGVDSVSCGSTTAPCRTIAYGYAKTVAGDTVLVKAGTYTDFRAGYGIKLDRSGTAGAPITIKSEIKWGAVIDGQNNATRGNGVYFTGNYNILDGFVITRAEHVGVAVYGDNNTVIRNRLYRNGKLGDVTSSFGRGGVFSAVGASGTRYISNTIDDNGRATCVGQTYCNLDHGLYLCGDNELVTNNFISKSSANGIQVAGYETVSNLRIINNVIANTGSAPHHGGVLIWKPVSNITIKNNIFYNTFNGVTSYHASGTGVVVADNIFYALTGSIFLPRLASSTYTYTEGAKIALDPLFVNSTTDFHLRAGSPAINRGAAFTEVTTDIDGQARVQGGRIDIGADERQ